MPSLRRLRCCQNTPAIVALKITHLHNYTLPLFPFSFPFSSFFWTLQLHMSQYWIENRRIYMWSVKQKEFTIFDQVQKLIMPPINFSYIPNGTSNKTYFQSTSCPYGTWTNLRRPSMRPRPPLSPMPQTIPPSTIITSEVQQLLIVRIVILLKPPFVNKTVFCYQFLSGIRRKTLQADSGQLSPSPVITEIVLLEQLAVERDRATQLYSPAAALLLGLSLLLLITQSIKSL